MSHCCRNGPLTVPHGQLDHGQSLKVIEWKNGSVLSNRLTSFKQRCPHIVTFPPHQLSIKWMETTHQYMCMLNITTYNIPHCYFLSFNKLSKKYYFQFQDKQKIRCRCIQKKLLQISNTILSITGQCNLLLCLFQDRAVCCNYYLINT